MPDNQRIIDRVVHQVAHLLPCDEQERIRRLCLETTDGESNAGTISRIAHDISSLEAKAWLKHHRQCEEQGARKINQAARFVVAKLAEAAEPEAPEDAARDPEEPDHSESHRDISGDYYADSICQAHEQPEPREGPRYNEKRKNLHPENGSQYARSISLAIRDALNKSGMPGNLQDYHGDFLDLRQEATIAVWQEAENRKRKGKQPEMNAPLAYTIAFNTSEDFLAERMNRMTPIVYHRGRRVLNKDGEPVRRPHVEIDVPQDDGKGGEFLVAADLEDPAATTPLETLLEKEQLASPHPVLTREELARRNRVAARVAERILAFPIDSPERTVARDLLPRLVAFSHGATERLELDMKEFCLQHPEISRATAYRAYRNVKQALVAVLQNIKKAEKTPKPDRI